jgi:hypothetical protein
MASGKRRNPACGRQPATRQSDCRRAPYDPGPDANGLHVVGAGAHQGGYVDRGSNGRANHLSGRPDLLQRVAHRIAGEVDPSAYATKFSGTYSHRTTHGSIGHNLPQEAPDAFPTPFSKSACAMSLFLHHAHARAHETR